MNDERFENVETKLKIFSIPNITYTSLKIKTSSRIIAKRHPESQVIGDVEKGILTRRKVKVSEQANIAEHFCLISDFEPKVLLKLYQTPIGKILCRKKQTK